MSLVVNGMNPASVGSGVKGDATSSGESMSAPIECAASAICSPRERPGNASKRSPASHGEVELPDPKAVLL